MNSESMREEAGATLAKAEEAINAGNVDEGLALREEAVSKMDQAKKMDEAMADIALQKKEFSAPVKELPVASTDVEKYDPKDQTNKIKADYKPRTWVKGLPAAAQAIITQDQMGDNQKEEAEVYKSMWYKYMTAKTEPVSYTHLRAHET